MSDVYWSPLPEPAGFGPRQARAALRSKWVGDPRYLGWANRHAEAQVYVVGALILVLNPVFHAALGLYSGEPEALTWRLAPMIAAVAAVGAVRLSRVAAGRATLALAALFTVQLVSTGFAVVEAGHDATVAGAALLPYLASQLAFVRSRELLASLAVSFVSYVTYGAATGSFVDATDAAAVVLLGAGAVVGALLGSARIKSLEAELGGRVELANQRQALIEAERSARAAARAADAANRAKSTFLATMSHELRTPLNAIIGYSELLDEQARDEGSQHLCEDLGRIRGSGERLLALIDDVLDLSKVEAGRMEVVATRFGVAELLEEVGAAAEVLAERRGNRLELRVHVGNVEAVTDREKLRQILTNLLSNACKFTRAGVVRLEASVDGGELVFGVADTGIGMTPEQVGSLFQPFVQVIEPARREEYGGSGLGLVLSRRFAQLLGGDLFVSSRPGVGSTFVVRVPRELSQPHLL
jgi:signal transduction histidine kinase